MASIKDLKKRIATVKNTQQTTKAMKMVSAAKLRRAQDAIAAQRPYAKSVSGLMSRLASIPGLSIDSPLVKKEGEEGTAGRKLLLVLVTSDRGLCGGFNANIIKTANRWVKQNGSQYASVSYSFVGKRGYDYFKTKTKDLGPYYSELGGKVSFVKAKKLADSLVKMFVDGQFDEVKFIYNEFVNAVTQIVQVEDFLPLAKPTAETDSSGADLALSNYIVKPNVNGVFEALLSKFFSIQAFRVMLDSQASEHGARMSSMENASKNAAEMIGALTLEYNKQRQAGITKELLEIISGSESQKAS